MQDVDLGASNAPTCPVDGCGREVAFEITVTTENGTPYDIPVCPNHYEK